MAMLMEIFDLIFNFSDIFPGVDGPLCTTLHKFLEPPHS
jgi:hypothetical protein